MRLTFVTGNAGKVRELEALLAPHGIGVVQDAGGYPEVQAAKKRRGELLGRVAQLRLAAAPAVENRR